VRAKLVILLGCGLLAASGQECRVTPLSPAQPPLKVLEGEKSTESETFQTTITAVSPQKQVYFYDTASRIRRITPDGRMETVAGNGTRTDRVTTGDARAAGLPAVGQLVFSRDGVLHFSATGQIFRVANGRIELVAGSGRPGFNSEEGVPSDVNLGSITNFIFSFANDLMIVDGYNRVRRLDNDGVLRTAAGSIRIAATNGLTGDNGPAVQAALSSPRQIIPFPDGTYWIRDLSGRNIRLVTTDGVIRTVNQSFDTAVTVLQFPDGTPGASSANRVYPVRSNGVVETGKNPFPAFTGTPRAIDRDGALYFEGSTRPDQRAPLLRLTTRQELLAGAPVPPIIEGQAPPFGAWNPRSSALVYSSNLGTFSAVVQAQAGQKPAVVVGGGTAIGDVAGKKATDITVYGIVAFALDPAGRIIIGDNYRRRILVIEADGQATVLKNERDEEVVYAPLGSLSSLQRLTADNAGNIYWFQSGATPTGGVFEGEVAVWQRASKAITTFPVRGFYHLTRLADGTVAAIAGNGSNYRRVYQVTPSGLGAVVPGSGMLPYGSYTVWQDKPYFTAASRLFRGEFGKLEALDMPTLTTGATFAPDFVLAAQNNLIVHSTDGGFYRLEDPSSCRWIEQPRLEVRNVVNAANGQNGGTISPRQLIRVYGTGLGPAGGQGFVLDGSLRATGQAAPYPALTLGNFSGTIEFNAVTGTVLPVLYSDDTQAVYQGPTGLPASRTYMLYYSWQGLQVIHSDPVRVVDTTPALYGAASVGDAYVALAEQENGSRVDEANPARPGAVVTLIATGLGSMTNNLSTGEFCGTTPVATTAAAAVTIGGEPAEVQFAGCYPGTVAGTYQIRVTVPEGLEGGMQAITLSVGAGEMAANPRMLLPVANVAQ